MSSAGAGIGYALVTVEKALSGGETRLLLVALSLWALSFLTGLIVLRSLGAAIRVSKALLDERRNIQSEANEAHGALSSARDQTGNAIGRSLTRAKFFQVLFLSLGAVAFIFLKVDVRPALFGIQQ